MRANHNIPLYEIPPWRLCTSGLAATVRGTMDELLLREVAQDYLVPFFSGARLEDRARASTAREARVAFVGPTSIAFKINGNDDYRLVLTRSQPFLTSQGNRIPDIRIVESFVETVSDLQSIIESDYRAEVLPNIQRRIVSKAILAGAHEDGVLAAIDALSMWGQRLYEGAPIAASIGLRQTGTPAAGAISLDDFRSQDFSAVLSNGYDTLISFNYRGEFLGHEALPPAAAPATYCPIRQSGIAAWTGGHRDRVAISLNRLGEILIFHDQQLVFARRAGKWNFLTHDAVITQMNVPRDVPLRHAIYETCLDASFARTGACLGIVQVNNGGQWRSVIDPGDLIATGTSTRASALRLLISGRTFPNLDRRARHEISAIDGATVISHQGEILAAGAILRIGGGSTGGGRLAAARALSEYGLGIKVSQDGGITGWRPRMVQAAFRVM